MSKMQKNFDWLAKENIKYWNKWIALSDGKLLGASEKYKDLYDVYKDRDDVIITRILQPLTEEARAWGIKSCLEIERKKNEKSTC
jgi:hypothetical protein